MNNSYQVSFYAHALEDRVSPYQCMPILAHFSTEKKGSDYIDQLPKNAVHDLAMALLVGESVEIEFEVTV